MFPNNEDYRDEYLFCLEVFADIGLKAYFTLLETSSLSI